MKCSACQAEKVLVSKSGEPRLPTGWKRIGETIFCADCAGARYHVSAIELPIVGPVCTHEPGHKDSRPLEWPEFRERLKASWIATTQASNWVMRQCAILDPGMTAAGKLDKMPKTYFYPEIRKRWPALATCSVPSLDRQVVAKYRASRLKIATCLQSLPTMRYPVPLPVAGATYKVWEDEGGRLLTSFLLGESRVTVRLRGGQNYRRQLMGLRAMMNGEAQQCELSIYRRNASPSDHRNGDTPSTRVFAKFVARFPKKVRESNGVAAMHTGGDAFFTLYDANQQQILRWNGDHVKRRIQAHDEQLQRLREDLKAEKRLGRERDGILARMDLLAMNQRAWLHSLCHEMSASVVNLLVRRKIGTLILVDKDKSYVEHFPWQAWRLKLESKAAAVGIEIASADAVTETAQPLEGEE